MAAPALSPLRTLEGRRILLTGSTGFVGKVLAAMLLDRQPRLGKLFLLVRAPDAAAARRRFLDAAAASPVFEPLREIHGPGLEAFLDAKVHALSGDVVRPSFGLDGGALESLKGLDLVLHCAGLVALNPALDESAAANARGALHAAELAARAGAKLLHVSTAYVAGMVDGRIPEAAPDARRSPSGKAFDAAAELESCERFVRELREDAAGGFLGGAKGARRKRLVEEQLLAEGARRARHWGWPNVYCFTKALGERLVAATPGLQYAIVRPTIVESSLAFPFPGWNEGMTTSAPIIYAMIRGQTVWPIRASAPLDVIPVDLVCAGTIAAAAALLEGRHQPVYHLGSSDSNPLLLGKAVSLIGKYRRRTFLEFADGQPLLQWLKTRPSILTVPHPIYRSISAPAGRGLVRAASRLLERLGRRVPRKLTLIERELGQVDHIVRTFRPFIHDQRYIFEADGMRKLYASLPAEDRERLAYAPERIAWDSYWPDIHIEGLRRWVFPGFRARGASPAPQASPWNRRSRAVLAALQRFVYGRVFEVRVRYAGRLPQGRTMLVAANHASHLDMGLIKHALGGAGEGLAALAARDYFFRTPLRRFFFGNFTNLIPIDRRSGLKDALKRASAALASGRSVLLFPEGTRSRTGAMGSFKPSLEYLALKNGVDILPVFVEGTFESLPKGRALPRGRKLGVVIGRPLSIEELRRQAQGLPLKDACRKIASRVEAEVRELERREGRRARRRALVTGASSGIGRAIALDLASRGYDVAAVGRDVARLEALAEEARRRYESSVRPLRVDLSKPGAAAAAALELAREGFVPDALVHAAGFGFHGGAAETPAEVQAALMQANAFAAQELCRELVGAMAGRGEGRVLFVSSVYAFCGVPGQAAYAASKAWLWSYAQTLAGELEGSGVSVSCVCPGITRTEFRRRAGMPDGGPMKGHSAEFVARAAVRGMLAGKLVIVPGLGNRAFAALCRAWPAAGAAVLRRVNRRRGLEPAARTSPPVPESASRG